MPNRRMKNRPANASQKGHRVKKRKRGLIQKIIIGLFVLIVIGGAGLLFAYQSYAADRPALATMSDYTRSCPIITTVYDVRGRVIAEFSEERRILLEQEQI